MEKYSDEKCVPMIKDLDQLIEELHKVYEEPRINVEYVKALLSSYKSNPKDWKKFAQTDTHRYTRNLVDSGNEKFNLMLLCWGEGHGSAIHDHTDSHCFVKMLDGQLMESMFDWPNESEGETEMTLQEKNVYGKDGVTYINDSMGLHRMENPSHTERACSLHLYSPPFDSCKMFDQRTGHINEVKVTFWSKYGKRTKCETMNGCSVVSPPENN